MKYDAAYFDAGIARKGTRSAKWDEASICGKDDIPMWVADWDFPCAQPIVDAVRNRAAHPCFGYSCGDPRDAESFCGYWRRRHNIIIQPEQAAMLPCVVTGLKLCVRAFSKPGDGVLIFPPVYGPFYSATEVNGRRLAEAPLKPDANARYFMDFDAVEQALQGGVRCILFCNPQNPVSRAWTREELQRLVDLARAYNAVLVSDEIHADFIFKGYAFTPILSLPGAADCAISLASASKTFNIPGLQQSMAVAFKPELLDAIKKEATAAGVTSGNIFALAATQQAYTACDDWLDGMMAYLEDSKAIIQARIKQLLPRAILTPIEATCLAWLDLRAYAPTTEELARRAKEQHVVLTGGTFFGKTLGDGFLRLNFGCPHAQLEEALTRLGKAFAD